MDIIGGIGAYDDVFEGHATQNTNYNAVLSHSELMYSSRLVKNEVRCLAKSTFFSGLVQKPCKNEVWGLTLNPKP